MLRDELLAQIRERAALLDAAGALPTGTIMELVAEIAAGRNPTRSEVSAAERAKWHAAAYPIAVEICSQGREFSSKDIHAAIQAGGVSEKSDRFSMCNLTKRLLQEGRCIRLDKRTKSSWCRHGTVNVYQGIKRNG